MKYIGEKSLSSTIHTILRIAWYFIILMATGFFIFAIAAWFFIPWDNPAVMDTMQQEFAKPDFNKNEWNEFINLPIFVKIILIPYFWAVVGFLLQIIKKSQLLFKNLTDNKIFNNSNVELIAKIAKLTVIYAILTFSFTTALTGLLLFVLTEIFKNGTTLQEEHDLTV